MAGRVFDTMTAYFEKIDWEYGDVGDGLSVALNFQGSEQEWRCVAQAVEPRSLFLFYSLCPVSATEATMAETADYVARANFGMYEGAFELDPSDGELRYRTSMSLIRLPEDAWPPGDLARTLIGECVQSNVLAMDAYLAGLIDVALGKTTSGEAIATAEGSSP